MSVMSDLVERYRRLTPVSARPDNPDEDDAIVQTWFSEGAAIINNRLGTTTQVATAVTLVAGQSVYDLPAGWKRVDRIIPKRDWPMREFLGVPVVPTTPPLGVLPNGQEVTESIDLINRMSRYAVDKEIENGWRIRAGKLIIEFSFLPGSVILVEGSIRDGDVEHVPAEHYDLLVIFVRWKAIEAQIHSLATTASIQGEGTAARAIGQLSALRNTLLADWRNGVSGLEGSF